ncbi:MAG: methylmalonyl-CoA carboxyltransferase [Acidimicrobiia bacterium]|nr:methylmalonyl-CoA carboxyltransferase [Acidimicrobiia bacterium]
MTALLGAPLMPVAADRQGAARAELRELDGRLVGWFRLEGGKRRGAIGPGEGETITRLVGAACDAGVPIVGVLATSGADLTEGVASLHAWGTVARALSNASGAVPVVLCGVGPCVSGPSLLMGLADAVVMTSDAFAYVSGPATVTAMTGQILGHHALGGSDVHRLRSGVAALVVEDEDALMWAVSDLLSYLPSNNCEAPPIYATSDRNDRLCTTAADLVPATPTRSYDMRAVVSDVVDRDSFLELWPSFAPNLVTGLARLAGQPVGVVANQPNNLAGTLDIAASQKGARFVQWCDAFNLPLVTFVDTPGYQPGKDLEWRGIIRHGAQLVHAYAAATVPRLGVVVRKAYGGAYIVMDCKALGNDYCCAWPGAEIAVMGAPGAVAILEGKRLAAVADVDERDRLRTELEDDYQRRYCTPSAAAERGFVDELIDPRETRRVLCGALRALAAKREHLPRRRHANGPL